MPLLEVWASRLQRGASFPRGPKDARGTTPARFSGTHGPQASRPRLCRPRSKWASWARKSLDSLIPSRPVEAAQRATEAPISSPHFASSGPHPRALLPIPCSRRTLQQTYRLAPGSTAGSPAPHRHAQILPPPRPLSQAETFRLLGAAVSCRTRSLGGRTQQGSSGTSGLV